MTLRFLEFVRMHSQNAAFCLGLIPHPQTGKAEVNLEVAHMLIDQLASIAVKTQGNLNSEEKTVIDNALSSLRLAYVEAQQKAKNPTAGGTANKQ